MRVGSATDDAGHRREADRARLPARPPTTTGGRRAGRGLLVDRRRLRSSGSPAHRLVDVEQALGDHVGVEGALGSAPGRRWTAPPRRPGPPAARRPAPPPSAARPSRRRRSGTGCRPRRAEHRPAGGQRLDDHRRQHVVPGAARRPRRPRRATAARHPGAVQRAEVVDVATRGRGRLDRQRAQLAVAGDPQRRPARRPGAGARRRAAGPAPSPGESRARNRKPSPSGARRTRVGQRVRLDHDPLGRDAVVAQVRRRSASVSAMNRSTDRQVGRCTASVVAITALCARDPR